MNRQFKRILDLVRRTGDRMIVTDPDGENSYVVMGLDQYEDLLGTAESGWSPEMDGDLVDLGNSEPAFAEATAGRQETEELPDDIREAVEHDLKIIEDWQVEKGKVEQKSEEKGKIDPDEERFYLEPIE